MANFNKSTTVFYSFFYSGTITSMECLLHAHFARARLYWNMQVKCLAKRKRLKEDDKTLTSWYFEHLYHIIFVIQL